MKFTKLLLNEKILYALLLFGSLQESVSITVWNFFIHVNVTVVGDLVLNFVSWGVSDLWVVRVVCCVVSEASIVVIDWVDVDAVGVVVEWLDVVDVVGDFVNCVHVWVVGVDVVSVLGDYRSRVDVVVFSGDDWFDSVLFGVLVLGGVGILVVLSWSVVSVDWLGVGVLMDINDWVVVWVVWVVRVAGWVGVDCLVIVVDGFVVDWGNLVGSEVLEVVLDGLMWHGNVPLSSVVLVGTSMSVCGVVGVLEGDVAVLIIMVVGSVVDFVISFVIDVLVSNRVMFGLSALNMWLNLVNAGLLERSVV